MVDLTWEKREVHPERSRGESLRLYIVEKSSLKWEVFFILGMVDLTWERREVYPERSRGESLRLYIVEKLLLTRSFFVQVDHQERL